ncbi:hypothetical protein [Flavisolibacter nicotianae]|uniref:hypothetical protein n=1 Tax=Flavisolibacter nicotianae TaxID=2364882 RepID=UPI000EB53002|nr:hypothetical protein [Flavisolibacter nicotianae]
MKILLTSALAIFSFSCFAQKVVDVDKSDGVPINSFYTVNGTPVSNVRYVRVTDGTPYFRDSWMKGVAISAKDARYQNPRVKLDLMDNEVHFLVDRESELICTIPLKDITLTDTINGTSYHFVWSPAVPGLSSVKKGWYLQLAEGKASLYQVFNKTIQEFKPFNSPVAEQKIVTTEDYLLAYNGSLLHPKKWKEIPALLADKKEALDAFLKTDRMKEGSNAERMAAIVSYYNSLQ